jgi:VWFA-related protein
MRTLTLALQLATAMAGAAAAQTQASPPVQNPVIKSTSQEVLLDMIVRDKRGRPIRDLEQNDVELTDNGVVQKVTRFRLVEGEENLGKDAVGSTTGATALNPLRQVRLVTLAFERLGQDGRTLSRQAALDLLKNETGPNLYFGVFAIDQRLAVLQQYTSDKELVKKAILRATQGTYTMYVDDSQRIANELQILATQSAASQQVTQSAQAAVELAKITLASLQFAQAMDFTQQGRASIFGLMAMVKEQYRLPGRKTMLYFTEGLYVPQNLQDIFKSMIGMANRCNVSVYAVDSKGLTANSQNAGGADALQSAVNSIKDQQTQGDGVAIRPDQVKALDLADDSTRMNLQNSLADLSESTGGFLIANSNDLRTPLRRVSEDINTYYELSYTPQIDKYDGSFRKISVRIARADVKVQTRNGYFALPFLEGQALFPYEMPMLNALNTMPLARAVPFHSTAMHFQKVAAGVQTAIVMDVPMESITPIVDEPNRTFRTHLSVLALVKNQQGEIVQKLSQDVPLQYPLDKLDAAKQSHFTYLRHVELPTGRYTIETAVLDQEGQKVGAKKAIYTVSAPQNGVGLSSVTLIRRVDPSKADDPDDPFHFQGGKVTPSLTSEVKGGPNAKLSCFFVVYPQPGVNDKTELFMDFLQDGKLVGRGTPALPAPNERGRIPYVATSPIDGFKPGLYELRVTVKQAAALAQEHMLFTVEE